MYMKNLHKVYIDDSKIDTLLQNFDVKSPAMVKPILIYLSISLS